MAGLILGITGVMISSLLLALPAVMLVRTAIDRYGN